MNEPDLRAQIDAAAAAGGLARWGVASVEVLADTREILHERKAAGIAADMQFTYRNPDRSTDPSRILDGARSIIVGALPYRDAPTPTHGQPSAVIARYATSDYYGELHAALEPIKAVCEAAGHTARIVIDNNALVDRAIAQRAGIGWFGKNANILVPGIGSWVVLGSVITTAELTPNDQPVADGCSTCTKCIDDCPTGAIIAPGTVDARRCLAWLVQRAGDFPTEFRRALGTRLYGCDDCQEVCPHNAVVDRREPVNAIRTGDPGPAVEVRWLLTATDQELMDTLGRFYIANRDPSLWRRNALVVAGNLFAAASRAGAGITETGAETPAAPKRTPGFGTETDTATAPGSTPPIGASAPTGRAELAIIVAQFADSADEMLASHARWALAQGQPTSANH